MPAVWFVRSNGQVHGPLDTQQLVALAAAGKIEPTTEIAQSKTGPWYPGSKVKGLRFPGEVSSPAATAPTPKQTPDAAVAVAHDPPQQQDTLSQSAALDAGVTSPAVETHATAGIGQPDDRKKGPWPLVIVLGVIGFTIMFSVWQRIYTGLAYPVRTKFEVLQDEPINNGSIREVYVRIEQPVAEDQVKAVAYNVLHSSYSSCPKTKVWFLLPAQRIGGGAWASATFRPELEVLIIGSSVGKSQALARSSNQVPGRILGQWTHNLLGTASHKITLEQRGNSILMHRTFVDQRGESATDTKSLEVLGPNRYRYPGSTESWMSINSKGNLEIRDPQGLVDTAPRLN
jgi:hypothetical protein